MTTLIARLPTRTSSDPGDLYALYNANEGNTMTDAQVSGALAKHWNTKRFDGTSWVDYQIFILGDVDGDGKLSIGDVADLIDLIMSGTATVQNYPAADVDGDGRITIGDASDLIDLLIGNN